MIVATLSSSKELTHESMSSHDPKGTSLCIHSVVVTREYQRKGIALSALRAYIDLIKMNNKVIGHHVDEVTTNGGSVDDAGAAAEGGEGVKEEGILEQILLIAKGELLSLYLKAGFHLIGLSKIVHGKDPWFEMALDLSPNFYIIDTFTSKPLGGNQAGVVFHIKQERQQQMIANELNLPCTAFITYHNKDNNEKQSVSNKEEDQGEFDICWYTPSKELDLCGHGTLAAMHALITTLRVDTKKNGGIENTVKFHTRKQGIIFVNYNVINGHIKITFKNDISNNLYNPAGSLTVDISLCLGLDNINGINGIVKGEQGILIELKPDSFYKMKPQSQLIQNLKQYLCPHFIVTSKWNGNHDLLLSNPPLNDDDGGLKPDIMSRVFYEDDDKGIVEDYVCGSAHRLISAYWLAGEEGGTSKLSNSNSHDSSGGLVSWQASSRGGFVIVERGEKGTTIQGKAATSCEGKLMFHVKA